MPAPGRGHHGDEMCIRDSYKGPLADTVYQLVGGLRSSMGYCGTPTIELSLIHI